MGDYVGCADYVVRFDWGCLADGEEEEERGYLEEELEVHCDGGFLGEWWYFGMRRWLLFVRLKRDARRNGCELLGGFYRRFRVVWRLWRELGGQYLTFIVLPLKASLWKQ